MKRKIAYANRELIEPVKIRWQDFAEKFVTGPTQRNTEEHAKLLRPKLMKGWSDVGLDVAAFELPDGTQGKLNGHTRCFLWWNDEEVPKPPKLLNLSIYFVDSIEEAARFMLEDFDNPLAAHRSNDDLYGVFRFLGVDFKSQALRDKKFISALQFAQRMLDPTVGRGDHLLLVRLWLRELRLLDKVMPTRKRFPIGFLGAALLLLRRYGKAALPFLTAYENDRGRKDGGEMDAQEAFNEKAKEIRAGASLKYSTSRYDEILRVMILGYEAVAANQMFRNGIDWVAQVNGTGKRGDARFRRWLEETRALSGGDLVR
jgi:hypothetical protein